MQSFRERCGFHGNQPNYQQASQDSSRLENYRHQSQPGLNCERQRLVAKEYYNQQSYQGYENRAAEKYHRTNKQLPGQQLQSRPSFSNYGIQENKSYSAAQYSGEESLQNWGASQQQALVGDLAKYEADLMKKAAAVPSGSRQYQEQAAQLSFRAHSLHLPQQSTVPYPKLQRQKIQNDVSASPMPFSQSTHFTQHSQTFPASLTYSSAQGATQSVHSYKSCTAPSNQHHERVLPSASMAPGQRVQSLHGYQPNRIGYDQPQPQQQQPLPGRHHGQETIHYQNLTKYQHYNQPGQTYCQSEAPVRTPEQYYQTFSPGSSHSPARSVGRSPSYSSTPSPLMPNLENFQYNQQSLNSGVFPAGIAEHSHFMPLLNPSPTDTTSPDPQSGNCKNLRKDKIAEKLLSDLNLQSLTALTSQVENISNTGQLLSKSGMPQKKSIKNPARTPEQLKGQHCSPESSTYSAEQIGTPLSEPLGTPQSVHTEALDADYLSGSEDQLERSYLYCSSSRSPARANNCKTKPESVSTCSLTSPDDMSTKSDDSFQSIHATLPLETLAKYVSNERECPQLMVGSLSQEDLSSEMIALQEAIDNDKTGKVWTSSSALEKNDSIKSPLHLENHGSCLDPTVQSSWSNQGDTSAITEALKLDKPPVKNNCKDFSDGPYENTQVQFPEAETKSVQMVVSAPVSSASYSCYSNTTANSMCSKTTDHFAWPDKSIESCLRWKELELGLNSSDLPKGLFQSKFVGSDKEKKDTCHLIFQGDDPPMDIEPSEDFSKEEKEDENLSFREDSKADSELWLEDTRQCCDSDDFQEISMIASPDLKESDLEPEDYSPLCDLTSLERKSVIYEASLPKSSEKTPAVSSKDGQEAASESVHAEEKENSVPSPHLSGQSVILLGPAVGTDSKVKSWFESSLPHMNPEEETGGSEETDVEKAEDQEATLDVPLKSETTPENTSQITAEELLKAKSLHTKRIPCSVLEGDECREPLQTLVKDLQAASDPDDKGRVPEIQSESTLCKSSHGQPAKLTSEGLPARMCTRSFSASADSKTHGPLSGLKASYQDKLSKRGAFMKKQKVGFKAGKRTRKVTPKAVQTPGDQNAVPVPNVVPENSDPGDQNTKDLEPKNVPVKDQRSMILRSRTRTQELFHVKKRREKRTGDTRHKHHKTAKKIIPNNHVPSAAFKIPASSVPRAGKGNKRVKLPKSGAGIGGKMSERPLHSLKRKSAFISPIPAKKRSLILRSASTKEEKSEAPPSLFKKMPLPKKEKAKLSVRKSCEVILKSPVAKGTHDGCVKFSSRASFQGPVKTKVLPPRKGRGLKLEAIVQKIASPNLKKFACTTANAGVSLAAAGTTVHSSTVKNGTSDTERAIKHASTASAMEEDRLLNQDPVQKAFVAKGVEQSCRNSTKRSLKGRPVSGRKLPPDCHKAETYSCPETVQHSSETSMAVKSVSLGPKRRNRKGKSAILSKPKMTQDTPIRAFSSAHSTPKEGAASGNTLAAYVKDRPGEGKQPKTGDQQFLSEKVEGRCSQTRAQKRVNHASFNSYSKRQRKGLSRKKSNSRARRRRQAPLVNPIEPEIKLKYVSCKPLRVDNRAKPFVPYVRVEKKNEFTTSCDIINSLGEESRFHLEQGSALAGTPASKVTLPPSSVMQVGPLVSKVVNASCIVCCLCRNPANYRDLGDLCGPYYPEDCLPKKKSKTKDRVRADSQGGEVPQPQSTERTFRVADSNCTISGKQPKVDNICADPGKQNTLRSSTRGVFRKLQSCYCCNRKAEGEETEKPKRHQCSKAPEPLSDEPLVETQEHWVHEACTVWASGVYLIAGKLYGLKEATEMAADVVCSSCQRAGASIGCCHKGCARSYHYPCATDTGCLLSEENFSLKCLRHKQQAQ